MENPIDKKLLISYVSGTATPHQKRQVELWLDSHPEHWDVFYQYLEVWERSKPNADFDSYTEFIHLTGRLFSAAPADNSSRQKNTLTDEPHSSSSGKTASAGKHLPDSVQLPAWFPLNRGHKIAAAILITLSFSAFTFFIYNSRFTTHTACNTIKKITLPDNSTVILNTQAEIRHLSDWKNQEIREVWLKGEAFFSVTHSASQQKFIVHAADDVDVEVLGTQFNVSRHTNRTRVVLNDGKIRLLINNKGNISGTRDVLMNPGELVEFGASAKELTKKTVNPGIYSSWKDNRLVFDNSTLTELKMLLEERYKLEVIATDTSLNHIRFNGDFPSGNLQLLLNALAATYNLQVSAGSDKVYLQSRSALNN